MKGGPPRGTDATDSREPAQVTVSLTPDSVTEDRAAIPVPGDLVGGKYRVEGVLGEGGMGVVLAATHVKLGRKVALKLLRRGVQTDARALRLVREGRSTSHLASPHVAALLDVEELPDHTPYLVLERLEGETFAALLRRSGPLPLDEAADVLVQAAIGLAAAHAAGIVHRDVKPSNLFLARDAAGGVVVKVLDFGIAKFAVPGDVTLTDEAARLGSPAYMSPEQTREAANVDARTDVWSLGVTLFEAVAGGLPFPGGSAHAVAARVLGEPPRRLAELRPDLPPEAVRLVESCLEKDPARRCPSALALLEGLLPFASARGAALGRRALAITSAGSGWEMLAIGAAALAFGAVAAVGVARLGPTGRDPERRTPPVADRGLAPKPPASTQAAASAAPAPFAPKNARRVTFDEGCEEFPWWTPDGRSIAYNAASGSDTRVFLLDVAAGTRRMLTNEPGWQIAPAVSPTGADVAYIVMSTEEQATYRVSLDGSGRRRLSTDGKVRPSFSPDGAFVWLGDGVTPERVDVKTGKVDRRLHALGDSLMLNVLELPDGRLLARALPQSAAGVAGLILFPAGKDDGTWLLRAELQSVLEPTADGTAVYVARATASQSTELWRVPLDGSPASPVAGTGVLATKGMHVSPDGRQLVWSNCHDVHDLATLTTGRGAGVLAARPRAGSSDWMDDDPSVIPGTSSVLLLSTRMGAARPCVVDTTDHVQARCIDVGGLDLSEPIPSPDGKWFSFQVAGSGVYVAPLDGSAPPRRLTESHGDERHGQSAITPDGKEVYFTVNAGETPTRIEAVPFEGGASHRVLEDDTRAVSFSPKGDTLAFLRGTHDGRSVPTLMDLATKQRRALSPELGEGNYSRVVWSARGDRAAVIRTVNEVIEVDVATGKALRRFDAGNDQVSGLTYVGGELVMSRILWVGDIWVADL